MRGTTLPRLPSRIKGRLSLLRRLRALTIAAHRFDRGRARTPEDIRFAACLIDGLTATLRTVDPEAHVDAKPIGTAADTGDLFQDADERRAALRLASDAGLLSAAQAHDSPTLTEHLEQKAVDLSSS